MPFNVLLRTTLDLLQEKDPAHIFAEPVNLSEASPPTPLPEWWAPLELATGSE